MIRETVEDIAEYLESLSYLELIGLSVALGVTLFLFWAAAVVMMV